MDFDSEKDRRNFEALAYLEAENLRFKASTAQQALNYFIEADEGSRLENWGRASFKEEVKDAQEHYEEVSRILEVTELFDLYERPREDFTDSSEEKDYRNKWKDRGRYRREIGDIPGIARAEAFHEQNIRESERYEDIHSNPLNCLFQARHDYEKLISAAEEQYDLDVNEWENVDVDTSGLEDSGQIIRETEDPLEPEEIDFSYALFSKLI